MESLTTFIRDNWTVIAQNAALFLVLFLIAFGLGLGTMRAIVGGELAANRERLEQSKEELVRARGAKDALTERLDAQDKQIAELRNELATRPRIHISPDGPDPKVFKEGEVWLQYDKGKQE